MELRKKTNWIRTLLLAGVVLGTLLIGARSLFVYMFLSPLKASTLKIPTLNHRYKDPAGLFDVRTPVGWETLPTSSGVKIRPRGFDQYMGVSDVNILVRRMDQVPESPRVFLEKMAKSLIPLVRAEKKKEEKFRLEGSLIKLINNETGVWTVLDLNRFGIPMRQASLFGIKKGRYFCSVSINGLTHHSTLFQVLALGLFETLDVHPSS